MDHPQILRNHCTVRKTVPSMARPVPRGKQQICGRAGCGTRVLCHIPICFSTSQTPRGPSSSTGLLNPLDSPHHMRQDEESEFREGIVVDRPTRPGHGSFVNCGMKKEVKIDKNLEPGLRVTVQLNQKQLPESKTYRGKVVSSQDPRTKAGLYWGYTVRLASCLSAVFAEAPFQDGYDLTIGTSERGSDVASAQLPSFRHALVVFGGLQGLEAGVDADPNLEVAEPSVLFDLYVNTCPSQGSRTIRTEEAILISLAALQPGLTQAGARHS
uniref:28S rRNA (uridine-N(3))-methyltransferase n=1 Tax=Rousettus aegyptiacus TaxID=9407 RepID=A0A7J8ITN8_ROUAE|nr:SPOUT domain containing methyltransferase 1 [Rousettus aegyptiacus]